MNKYENIYKRLIDRALRRQQGKSKNTLRKEIGYIEKHHIIPEFFFKDRKRKGPAGWLDGNPDNKDNLVFLTAKEHMLCHLLLVKIYPGIDGLITACINMIGHSDKKISIRLFEKLREDYAGIVSKRFEGISKTQEHKDNLSKSLKGKPVPHQLGDKNAMHRPGVKEKALAKRKGKLRVQERDSIVFKFQHIGTNEIFEGTRQQFRSYAKITPVDVYALVSGSQKTSKKWRILTENT